jgi:hypothetical protein
MAMSRDAMVRFGIPAVILQIDQQQEREYVDAEEMNRLSG